MSAEDWKMVREGVEALGSAGGGPVEQALRRDTLAALARLEEESEEADRDCEAAADAHAKEHLRAEAAEAERDEARVSLEALRLEAKELRSSLDGCTQRVVALAAERETLREHLEDRTEQREGWRRQAERAETERDALRAEIKALCSKARREERAEIRKRLDEMVQRGLEMDSQGRIHIKDAYLALGDNAGLGAAAIRALGEG